MNKISNFMNKKKNNKRNSLITNDFEYKGEIIKRRGSLDLKREIIRQYKTESLSRQDFKYEKEHSLYTTESGSSIVSRGIQQFDLLITKQVKGNNNLDCNKCKNVECKNDTFMILNCGHIYHINCLVESHFDKFNNCGGVIDQTFCSNCVCDICYETMDIEDIIHIHNKFTKTTKDYLKIQNEHIEILDEQMNKMKEEMINLLECKQKSEDKKNKSKQITMSLNNYL